MINRMQIVSLLLLCYVSNATARLKCFTCDDCPNKFAKSTTCLPSQDSCLKFTSGEYVYKQCAMQYVCSLGAFQQHLKWKWKRILNYLDRQQQDDYEHENKKIIDCCHSDYCNGAEFLTSIQLMVLVVLPLYFI